MTDYDDTIHTICGDELIRARDPRPCWICNHLTHYVSISFETPICPGPCIRTAWDRYITDMQRTLRPGVDFDADGHLL